MAAPLQFECHGKLIFGRSNVITNFISLPLFSYASGRNYAHRMPPMQPLSAAIPTVLQQVGRFRQTFDQIFIFLLTLGYAVFLSGWTG